MTRRTIKPAAVKTESFSIEEVIAVAKAIKKRSTARKTVAKKVAKSK